MLPFGEKQQAHYLAPSLAHCLGRRRARGQVALYPAGPCNTAMRMRPEGSDQAPLARSHSSMRSRPSRRRRQLTIWQGGWDWENYGGAGGPKAGGAFVSPECLGLGEGTTAGIRGP